uniref:Uncharacterized protein n=1 Tax=Spongospora subterranea TaxID=70186 RepID=A0A0H5QLR2_9EUKA|eukprot:CRZ02545.1 hypothetical protein [Spongospora subterranea]
MTVFTDSSSATTQVDLTKMGFSPFTSGAVWSWRPYTQCHMSVPSEPFRLIGITRKFPRWIQVMYAQLEVTMILVCSLAQHVQIMAPIRRIPDNAVVMLTGHSLIAGNVPAPFK